MQIGIPKPPKTSVITNLEGSEGVDVVNGALKTNSTVSANESSPTSPTSALVGTASSVIVASNADRAGLIIINISTSNVSFGLGGDAVLGSGITLVPNAAWEMDSYSFTTAAISAIAADSDAALSIQEFNK